LGGCGFDAVEEVPVADGDHDLGAESSGGREGAGGEGCLGRADEAVEALLGEGAAVQVRCRGGGVEHGVEVDSGAVTPAVGGVRGGGAGVGGGVHDGGEDFVLVGGGADFEVVEAAAFVVEEDALAVAEVFFGRFGAVLVEGVDAAVGDAGEEVVVVFDRGQGEGVFHVGDRAGVGDVADFVQGGGDDGCGAGRDDSGGEGGGGFFAGRRHGAAGESGAGECGVSEGKSAAGFGGADPEPGAEELSGVPGPVVGRGPGHGTGRDPRGGGVRTVGDAPADITVGVGVGGGGRGWFSGRRFSDGGFGAGGCDCFGFTAPACGPACCAAGGLGGVDRLGPCPVHRGGGKYLQVFDTAGEVLGQFREICRLKESSAGQLLHHRSGRRVQQRQGRLQIRRRQHWRRQPGPKLVGGLETGGSTAVGRVLSNGVRTGTSRRNAAKRTAAQQSGST
jgi:hypothetical protein